MFDEILTHWDDLQQRLSEAFRKDRLQDWPAWRETLEQIATRQRELQEQTADWIGSDEADERRARESGLLADQQLRLSNDLERLEEEVARVAAENSRAPLARGGTSPNRDRRLAP
ncbi:MAG: hypothetical protein R3B96_08250 [Pirellulaceae bacterium]